jgi:hypothetical protein
MPRRKLAGIQLTFIVLSSPAAYIILMATYRYCCVWLLLYPLDNLVQACDGRGTTRQLNSASPSVFFADIPNPLMIRAALHAWRQRRDRNAGAAQE